MAWEVLIAEVAGWATGIAKATGTEMEVDAALAGVEAVAGMVESAYVDVVASVATSVTEALYYVLVPPVSRSHTRPPEGSHISSEQLDQISDHDGALPRDVPATGHGVLADRRVFATELYQLEGAVGPCVPGWAPPSGIRGESHRRGCCVWSAACLQSRV